MVSAKNSHDSRGPGALSPRQRAILAFVTSEIERGRAPTRADIADRFNITRATAQQHVVALERRGVLRRLPGARGLALPEGGRRPEKEQPVPIIGRIAAGAPLWATEDLEGVLEVASSLFGSLPDVLLRVTGESMAGAGILDGDLIAIRRATDAPSGQIIVARLGDEITVKRLKRWGAHVELVPENALFSTVRVDDRSDFAIEGVVIGVLRRY